MSSATLLGEFEQVVLLAILRAADNAYGVTIRAEIEVCTGRDPSPGALYTTLDRLEEKGLVASGFGEPTPQRGGRAKRYFLVTSIGIDAITPPGSTRFRSGAEEGGAKVHISRKVC